MPALCFILPFVSQQFFLVTYAIEAENDFDLYVYHNDSITFDLYGLP